MKKFEKVNKLHFHPIHPFPARMAPSIAWESFISHEKNQLRILDPMIGSGTSAVVARSLGHSAIGFDSDPLSVLMAKVWCTDVDKEKLLQKAKVVLDRAYRYAKDLSLREAYPINSDQETRAFIRYWFDGTSRRQLACLSVVISRLHDLSLKSFLWCAFSRMIITKKIGVSLAMDISHSRPHKVYDIAPVRPFDRFLPSVESFLNVVPFKKNGSFLSEVNIQRGDARCLPLESKSIDLVITSPPYLNAIDYIRCHKFSLVWMGYSLKYLRDIRSTNIGTERSITLNDNDGFSEKILQEMGNVERLPDRSKSMLIRYIIDMNAVLSEIGRVLVGNGHAVFVVGDSTIKGTFIQNSKAIISLAERHRLTVSSIQKRALPENRRYLPPPTAKKIGSALKNRMREEVIINFTLN